MAAAAPRVHFILLCIAALLAGCGAAPVQPQWAIAPLLRVAHAGGDDPAALYRLGRYHQQRGEPAAAAEAFARSIALQTDQLDARNAQAVLLAGQGRQDEAMRLLEQLAEAFPERAQPVNNLGYLYLLRGEAAPARALFERALRLEPGHAQARANLARLTPAEPLPASASMAGAAASGAPAAADQDNASRLQLVQLAPNEFRLQERAALAAGAAAPATASIQIVNGNGVPGLGERTRRLLAPLDRAAMANAEVVNQRRHDQRGTVIEYLPGHGERARAMRTALRGRALLLPVRALPGRLALRLVLGHDHAEVRSNGPARLAPTRRPLHRLPNGPLLTMNSDAAPSFNQE
jgi:Tfp pilus assembly protein PilF